MTIPDFTIDAPPETYHSFTESPDSLQRESGFWGAMITLITPHDNHEPPARRRHPVLITLIALVTAIVCQTQGQTFAALAGYTIAAIAIGSVTREGGRP